MFLPENMERFTPAYAIAYSIMNSIENLRFDKESYFMHVLFFYTGYFIKEIENISPRVSIRYRNTRGGLIRYRNTRSASSCFHAMLSSPKLPLVFLLYGNAENVFYFLRWYKLVVRLRRCRRLWGHSYCMIDPT